MAVSFEKILTNTLLSKSIVGIEFFKPLWQFLDFFDPVRTALPSQLRNGHSSKMLAAMSASRDQSAAPL